MVFVLTKSRLVNVTKSCELDPSKRVSEKSQGRSPSPVTVADDMAPDVRNRPVLLSRSWNVYCDVENEVIAIASKSPSCPIVIGISVAVAPGATLIEVWSRPRKRGFRYLRCDATKYCFAPADNRSQFGVFVRFSNSR